MKIMHILILLVFAGVTATAVAETGKPAEIKIPVTEWTCEEFIGIGVSC